MRVTESLPQTIDFSIFPTTVSSNQVDDFIREGWRYLPTSILSTYKEDWTEWFAVREFVQNSLDETEGFEIVFDTDQNISYILDSGDGIDIKDMFLGQQKGATEQEIHCLRGVFGEGMKLALIPLLNDNKPVIVRTVGLDYFFTFIEETSSRKGSFKFIGIFTRPNEISSGTAIAVKNADFTPYLKYFAPTIAQTDPEKVLVTVRGGYETEWDECKVRQVYDIPGMIFVRDIFVQYMESFFGYNFWFDSTRDALGSDRVQIKHIYTIKREFFLLIEASATKYPDFIQELMRRINQGTGRTIEDKTFSARESLEFLLLDGISHRELGNQSALALYLAIMTIVGTDFSWSNDPVGHKALEHAGLVDLRGKFPDLSKLLGHYNLIRLPEDIAKAAELTDETVLFTPEDILTSPETDPETRKVLAERFAEVIKQCNALIKQLQKRGACKDTTIHFYIGEYKDEERVAGFYTTSSNEILIRMKNVFEFEDLMRVLIHEAAHAYCHTTLDWTGYRHEDCRDLSQGFEDALDKVATIFLMDAVKHYEVDFDELQRATDDLYREKPELDVIMQHKLQIVNNPYGLIRPKHTSDKDKRRIDAAFTRIAKNCYFGPSDVMQILEGFNPYGNDYSVTASNTRGHRRSALEIARSDKELLEKLGFDIPVRFQTLGKEDLSAWDRWVSGRPNDQSSLIPGEDLEDFDTCLEFIDKHPDPRVKQRNFLAALQIVNPPEAYEELHNMDSSKAAKARFEEGRFMDLPKLERLFYTALPQMDGDIEYYDCLDHWGQWGWASFKEKLIETAGMKVPADTINWYRILDKGMEARHPDNRRYTAYSFVKIAPRNPEYSITALRQMIPMEEDPQVLDAVLGSLHKLLVDTSWPGRTMNAGEGFDKYMEAIRDNYDHITSIAFVDDDRSYYREPLQKRLQRFERYVQDNT